MAPPDDDPQDEEIAYGGDHVDIHGNIVHGSVTGKIGPVLYHEYHQHFPNARPGPLWRGSPYRGLAPFDERDAEVFYGREQATAQLAGMLAGRLDPPSMLVVTGPSGAGKSSLLRAGLLPYLKGGHLAWARWPSLVMTPTADPLTELSVQLSALTGGDPAGVRSALDLDPGQAHLMVRQAALAAGSTGRVLLVVDQFEEVFTLAGAASGTFADVLGDIAGTPSGPDGRPAGLVVIGVRGDFWDRCADLPPLVPALRAGPFTVAAMSQAELRSTITGPAGRAGLSLENGLTDRILDDLRAHAGSLPGALPLLSQAMLLTWERRDQDSGTLTRLGYAATGGLADAVRTSAEAAYAGLGETAREAVQPIFQQLTAITTDGAVARRKVAVQELPGGDDAQAVLRAFIDRRLMVADGDSVEPAHDLLLSAWPRLASWLEQDLDNRALYAQARRDAEEWLRSERDPAFLYQGTRLDGLLRADAHWREHRRRFPPPTSAMRDFLDACADAAARRRVARSRRLARVAVALLVTVLIAGVIARQLSGRFDDQRRDALSRVLSSQSERLSQADPITAGLLAVAAARFAGSPQSRAEARYGMLAALATGTRGVMGGPVSGVAFSPDGTTLATTDLDGAIRFWDARTRRQLGEPMRGPGAGTAVAFNRDGTILASAHAAPRDTVEPDGTAVLWDVRSHRQLGEPLRGHTDTVGAVAFSPDGAMLASAGRDGMVALWDVRSHRQLGGPLGGNAVSVPSVAFSPDGSTLAGAGPDGTVLLWDVRSGRRIGSPMRTPLMFVYAVAFSPDGKTLASAHGDPTMSPTVNSGAVRLWDVRSRRPIGKPMLGHTATVNDLTFSPDGMMLASAGSDGTVRLWDTGTRRAIGVPLTGHSGDVHSVAFSPDGRTLASAGNDLRLWETLNQRSPGLPMEGSSQVTYELAFDQDGTRLVSADAYGIELVGDGGSGLVRVWDVGTRRLTGPRIRDPRGRFLSVAISPDGTLLATGGWDALARLWDVRTGRQVGEPRTDHGPRVDRVRFSPDGALLATGGTDGTAQLWEVRTLRKSGQELRAGEPGADLDDVSPRGVSAIAFSPDGAMMATATGAGDARLWDVRTRRALGGPLNGHQGGVPSVAFSPDGRTLATAGRDQSVRLWDTGTRREIGDGLKGHTGPVSEVAFSPDGRTLATASADHSVRLWDVAARRQIGEPVGDHVGTVSALAFSPDGTKLAAAEAEGRVRLWEIRLPADPRAEVCAVAARSLTEPEWERYVPDEPYRLICP
ncbi:nSTAND1 domain-containing NTPase [Nonomuraea sp. NPDC003201]